MPTNPAIDEILSAAYQARRNHQYAEAIEHYEAAATYYKQAAQPLREAHTLRHLADIHRETNSLEKAHRHYEHSLALYRQHPERNDLDLANHLRGYALLAEARDNRTHARTLWQEAKALYEAVHIQAGIDEAQSRLDSLAEE